MCAATWRLLRVSQRYRYGNDLEGIGRLPAVRGGGRVSRRRLLRRVRRGIPAVQLREFVRESDGCGGSHSEGRDPVGSARRGGRLDGFESGVSGYGIEIAI